MQATWWGDFHAQSEETIGTNSARDYFAFARDLAFCDFVGHQGNDFQISNAFWHRLNDLYREFDAPGRFVTLPGYEYSPLTHLGGDRNIFFFDEDRPIRRSSHALVEDASDIASDCNHVRDLFDALHRDGEERFSPSRTSADATPTFARVMTSLSNARWRSTRRGVRLSGYYSTRSSSATASASSATPTITRDGRARATRARRSSAPTVVSPAFISMSFRERASGRR